MPLTLIHGWGFGAGVWRPLIDELSLASSVNVVSLPGYDGEPDVADMTALVDWLIGEIAPATCLVGWSLGGLLAIEVARRCPDRVQALGLVASLPCFARQPGWAAGWEAAAAADITRRLQADPVATVQYVAALSAHGDQEYQRVRAGLRDCTQAHVDVLGRDLGYLVQADYRADLAALELPVYAWLGDNDALIGGDAATALRYLRPDVTVHLMTGCGHAPLLSQPPRLARELESLL